jgi:hypothetical protein
VTNALPGKLTDSGARQHPSAWPASCRSTSAYPSSRRRDDLSSRQVVPNASIELGTNLTLTFLRDKRAEANRIQQREPIHLGLPAVGSWNGS